MTKKTFFIFFIFIFFILSVIVNNNNNIAHAVCDATSGNPMGCIPDNVYTAKTIQQILIDILDASLNILFLVVMGFLIYGGYYWMTSMGNEERIRKSKQILTASIVGLLIVLTSLSIVSFVSDAIGVEPQNLPTDTGLFGGDLNQALANIINAALTLVGVIALAMTVYGGFRWMTAAGNEDTVSEAKRILTASIIGLIIIIISWAVVNFVIGAVNGA